MTPKRSTKTRQTSSDANAKTCKMWKYNFYTGQITALSSNDKSSRNLLPLKWPWSVFYISLITNDDIINRTPDCFSVMWVSSLAFLKCTLRACVCVCASACWLAICRPLFYIMGYSSETAGGHTDLCLFSLCLSVCCCCVLSLIIQVSHSLWNP